MDLRKLARDERTDLAEFLGTLTPDEWDTPSLCARWRVRDVVAHMISYDDLDVRAVVDRAVKGGFRLDRINAITLAEQGDRSPDQLLALLHDHLEPRGLTAAFGSGIALLDGLIHHQDIRRPLGVPRQIPEERLIPALRGALLTPVIRGYWRIRGVRVVATDLDWSAGRGLEVRGPAEALLMTIAGRHGIAAELSGPGQPKLAARIDG